MIGEEGTGLAEEVCAGEAGVLDETAAEAPLAHARDAALGPLLLVLGEQFPFAPLQGDPVGGVVAQSGQAALDLDEVAAGVAAFHEPVGEDAARCVVVGGG